MNLPPGPSEPRPFQLLRWSRAQERTLRRWHARYGDVFTMRLPSIGDFVLLARPEHVETVFKGDPEVLHAGEGNDILAPFVGHDTVLLLDAPEHLPRRRLLLPAFHGERMQAYAEIIQEETQRALDPWPSARALDVVPSFREITLRVILRAVYGAEADRIDALQEAVKEAIESAESPLVLAPGMQRDLGPLTPWREFVRRRDRMDAAIHESIEARRRDRRPGERIDVLSMLLAARDEDGQPLGDGALRDELATVLAAGHETTTTALAWTLYHILAAPEVQARLRDELAEVTGGGRLRPEHFGKLEYLEAVIREGLRLRPVVPIVARRLVAPFEVAGWTLPARTIVAPCIYLVHRNPEVWPEPDAFRPERFMGVRLDPRAERADERSESESGGPGPPRGRHRLDPYRWLPFGGGVRRCLGQAFALFEMRVVLATLLHRVELELDDPRPPPTYRRTVTMAPRGGVKVVPRRVRPRPSA